MWVAHMKKCQIFIAVAKWFILMQVLTFVLSFWYPQVLPIKCLIGYYVVAICVMQICGTWNVTSYISILVRCNI